MTVSEKIDAKQVKELREKSGDVDHGRATSSSTISVRKL